MGLKVLSHTPYVMLNYPTYAHINSTHSSLDSEMRQRLWLRLRGVVRHCAAGACPVEEDKRGVNSRLSDVLLSWMNRRPRRQLLVIGSVQESIYRVMEAS